MQRRNFVSTILTVFLLSLAGFQSAMAALPPVYVIPGKDKSVTAPVGGSLVMKVQEAEKWTVKTADPEVAAYKPSQAKGFYPGFTLHKAGTTTVTASDGTTTHTFTIVVTAKP